MRQFYGRWLELGATAFGEFFRLAESKGKTALDTEYEVHAYGTSALAHFYSNILGVKPESAGFQELTLAPHPGDLRWARGKAATAKGIVEVSWTAESGVFRFEATVPPGCSFKVVKPKSVAFAEFVINGEVYGAD